MVALEPLQDGFFVFLEPLGEVTGDGVETHTLSTKAGNVKVGSSVRAPSVHWMKLREDVDHCKTCIVFLCDTSSNSSDEEDGNREGEDNLRTKARKMIHDW